MFKIGYRTIKTAIGTVLAIMLAQWLDLHNFVSAGIITILCIQVTKRQSIKAAWTRFLACVLAMVFSSVFFLTNWLLSVCHWPTAAGIHPNNCNVESERRNRDEHRHHSPYLFRWTSFRTFHPQ